MDSTLTSAVQTASEHGSPVWTSMIVFVCLLGCVYLLMFRPARSDRSRNTAKAYKMGHISDCIPRSGNGRKTSATIIIDTEQRLFKEIRAILDRTKPLKEIRPADVRQHLKTKGLHATEGRILEAMDDMVTTYGDIGSRHTRNGSMAIWRLPVQSNESVLAAALSRED